MIDPIEMALSSLSRAQRSLTDAKHFLQYRNEGRIFNAQAVISDAEKILKEVKNGKG
jgi:hypothetical protein